MDLLDSCWNFEFVRGAGVSASYIAAGLNWVAPTANILPQILTKLVKQMLQRLYWAPLYQLDYKNHFNQNISNLEFWDISKFFAIPNFLKGVHFLHLDAVILCKLCFHVIFLKYAIMLIFIIPVNKKKVEIHLVLVWKLLLEGLL